MSEGVVSEDQGPGFAVLLGSKGKVWGRVPGVQPHGKLKGHAFVDGYVLLAFHIISSQV